MDAFYFGRSQRPLFGLRHAPRGQARQTAILLCPSWGHEYMRAYRGLRNLGRALAEAGYETLRFDYSGTGDSEGMALDARPEHWLDDIATAAAELRDLSGCPRLALLGLRFGGLLINAARARGLAADAEIYWDCPTDGPEYLQLMQQLDRDLDRQKGEFRARGTELLPHADNELCGHAWPPAIADAMRQLPGVAARPRQLWLQSADQRVPAPPGAEPLHLSEPSRWQDQYWTGSPWLAVNGVQTLIPRLRTWLP